MIKYIICCVAAVAAMTVTLLAQSGPLEVYGSRPVSLIADELEKRYPFVITYEDPSFYAPSQLQDVTSEVRRGASSSQAGRILVPRRESLSVQIPNAVVDAGEMQGLLEGLVNDYGRGDSPQFAIRRTEDSFDIVPIRNVREGRAVSMGSLLDAPISLPFQERTALEMIHQICASLGRADRAVQFGSAPTGALAVKAVDGAANERARDVLTRTLARSKLKMSWRLFFGNLSPEQQGYMLNVHVVK